jgi:hypothetical protein
MNLGMFFNLGSKPANSLYLIFKSLATIVIKTHNKITNTHNKFPKDA